MFSVIFPGQGSQIIGMGKEFFDKYNLVKELFKEADDVLGFSLSKIILIKKMNKIKKRLLKTNYAKTTKWK